MALPLIDAAELAASLHDPRLRVLDVRHRVGAPRQRDRYLAGHVPGAVYVELRDELAGDATAGRGRNPLPEPRDLEASLRTWGIDDDSRVVVVADAGAPSAGRAWWVLTWAGIPGVRILDGGIEAWVAAGGVLETDVPTPRPGTATVRPGALATVDVAEVPAFAERGALLDVREAVDHAGDTSDARTGHVPGAVSLPYVDLLASDGTVDRDGIRARLVERGVDLDAPVALTCGGGVAAAFVAALLEGSGVATRLHVGSWSEWASDPERPRAYA